MVIYTKKIKSNENYTMLIESIQGINANFKMVDDLRCLTLILKYEAN